MNAHARAEVSIAEGDADGDSLRTRAGVRALIVFTIPRAKRTNISKRLLPLCRGAKW